MTDDAQVSDAIVTSETSSHLWYKSAWDHLAALIVHWRSFLLTVLAVLGTVWGVSEAINFFLDIPVKGWLFFLASLVIALLSAIIRTVYKYVHQFPSGLEAESSAAKRVAQLQRPGWEYRLAQQLLDDKLCGLDRELKDLIEGRVFVPIKKHLSVDEYIEWVKTRPENIKRMIDVAQQLLVRDFPVSLASGIDQPADPAGIVAIIDRIRDLYQGSVLFEREGHEIAPPQKMNSLHRLQLCWTEPVRNGVQQLYSIIDEVLNYEKNSLHKVSFTIDYGVPPNIDAFCEELDRLERYL